MYYYLRMTNHLSKHQLEAALNSISKHLCIINNKGQILYVNKSWTAFAVDNGLKLNDWTKINYLNICENSYSQ